MQNDVQNRAPKIAYLGPPASFSHQAAIEAFRDYPAETLHPLPSFGSIFAAIQDSSNETEQSFTFAILPVENSTNGWVVQVLDLLTQCGLDPSSSSYPDVEIVAEHYLEVHHCLYVHPSVLNRKEPTDSTNESHIPISELNITALHTHPQVWGQCNNFLNDHFSPALTERIDMSSTSAAAAFVAKNSSCVGASTEPSHGVSSTGAPAAICSSLAGQQNQLGLVAANIEDEPGKNTTRFLVIRNRKLQPPPPNHLCQSARPCSQGGCYYKSLLTFTIPHTVPGSLASALHVFAKHDLNLTGITTRPSRKEIWHYMFFVECEEQILGQSEANGSKIPDLLPDLTKVAERTRWLGTWLDRSRHG